VKAQQTSVPDPCGTIHNRLSKISSFQMIIANCCSINNKIADLEALLHLHNVDLFIGTESHLDGTILDSEIFPKNYQVNRKNRNRHGGGVFILVRTDIPSSLLHQDVKLKLLWVHLHATNKQNIILGSFYCPQNPSASVFEELQTSLVNIKQQFPNAFILLGGDF